MAEYVVRGAEPNMSSGAGWPVEPDGFCKWGRAEGGGRMSDTEKLAWLLAIIACPFVVLAMPKEDE